MYRVIHAPGHGPERIADHVGGVFENGELRTEAQQIVSHSQPILPEFAQVCTTLRRYPEYGPTGLSMEHAAFNALLFCSDAQLLCTADRVFNEFQVTADVCLNPAEANSTCRDKDLDLLALDLDEPGAAEVMRV